MRTAPLHFICTIPFSFLRVGLCSPRVLPLQDTWRPRGCRIHKMRSQNIDRVDPIPRDHWWSTCVKSCICETMDVRHVANLGGVNLHHTVKIERDFRNQRDAAWTLRKASDPHRTDEDWWNEAILSGFIRSTRWWKSSSEENDRTAGGCRRSFLGDRTVDCHQAVDPPNDRGVLDRAITIVHLPEAIGRLAVVAEVF